MVTITLYTRQQKKHWCIEQSFGLCGRGRGWDDMGEWHWNMYNIIYETSHQSRFDTRYWMLGAGALERPRGMVWGGRREEGSEWGTHVYLWQIHFDIWQNQYNIVKFKNKTKLKKIAYSCGKVVKIYFWIRHVNQRKLVTLTNSFEIQSLFDKNLVPPLSKFNTLMQNTVYIFIKAEYF